MNGARLASATIAAAIALAWTGLAVSFGPPEWIELTLAAAPVVFVLGWLLHGWARKAVIGPLLTMGIATVPLTALVWIVIFLLPTGADSMSGDDLLILPLVLLYAWLIGVVIYGLPGLLLALPSAAVWLLLYRAFGSFVAKSGDGVHPRRAPGRRDAEEDADRDGHRQRHDHDPGRHAGLDADEVADGQHAQPGQP
jgi:hypothetical protein